MLIKKKLNYPFITNVFVFGIAISAVFYFFSTVLGTYNNYSAVPFWDMWNGYLDFYFRTKSEGLTPWWELHNEHRLVLAKIFFWLDLEYFKGSMVILFSLNIIFSMLACATFISCLNGLTKDYNNKNLFYMMSGTVVVLCFSWLQSENYTWAFQSQFHMAYLLPLWSILALVKSKTNSSIQFFLLSCVLGVLSAVTMANGLLALPVMIFLAILVRLHWRYVATLIIIISCVYFIYFIDYVKPYGHPSLIENLIENPIGILRYFLLYLSGPFYGIFSDISKLVMAMGALFLLSSLWILKYVLQSRLKSDEGCLKIYGLFAFLVFVSGTALLTSLGRAGYDPNIPSRYMTPAILNWCCLLIILTAMHYDKFKNNLFVYVALLFFPLALLPIQTRTLHHPEHLHIHKVAAVAAALGVHDDKILDRVYFDIDRLFHIIEPARVINTSIFNEKYIKEMYYFDEVFSLKPKSKCNIYVDKLENVEKSTNHSRVTGWAFDKKFKKVPNYIVFADSNNKVIGFSLTGGTRVDVAEVVDPLALNSGFIGYVLGERSVDSIGHIYGVSDDFVCEL